MVAPAQDSRPLPTMSENPDDPDRDAFVSRQYGSGTRWFAYSNNQVDSPAEEAKEAMGMGNSRCESIACPARFAHQEHDAVPDPSSSPVVARIAEAYDDAMRNIYDHDLPSSVWANDIADEETVKESWLRATARLEDDKPEAYKMGLKVAEALGWLEEGEPIPAEYYQFE